MKYLTKLILPALIAIIVAAVAFITIPLFKPQERTLIQFDIHQDMGVISESVFAEPPQFAIWLENPKTHQTRTVFVTYRSGKGQWVGKTECPAALPLWFEVFKKERNRPDLPNPKDPAPDAITGATPKTDRFSVSAEVKPKTKWICWIEVNLAGDFNAKYQQYGQTTSPADMHFSGQPALVYRAEIEAIAGNESDAKLFGQSKIGSAEIEPVSPDVTTAKDIFKSIKIRIINADR